MENRLENSTEIFSQDNITEERKPSNNRLENSTEVFDRIKLSTDVGYTGVGDSQFDEGVPFKLLDNLQQIRAERQPWHHQATHAIIGGITGGLLTAGETVSYILDIPSNLKATYNYLNKTDTVETIESNSFADAFKEAKEALYQEYLPIYKEEPDKLIDFNDSGFWYEAFRGVVDSAVGFGLTGMGAGAAVKGAGYGLRLARINNYNKSIIRGLGALGKPLQQGTAGRLSAAMITNYGESKMMALEMYEQAETELYQEYIEQYEEINDRLPSPEEDKKFKLDAKIAAGQRANNFMLLNKMFIATDYLQLNRMFKNSALSATRKEILKEPGVKQFLKDQLSSGPKEALEEIGQNVLQRESIYQARQDLKERGYDFPEGDLDNLTLPERIIEFATSEQALLEGAMGFFGGPIQYAVTQAPFNKGDARKNFIDQNAQFKRNEQFARDNFYNIFTGKALAEEAQDELKDSSVELQNDASFHRIALINFAKGTTGQLEEVLKDAASNPELSEEERAQANEKIGELQKLEESYNTESKKYAEPVKILHEQALLKMREGFQKKAEDEVSNYETVLNKGLQNYNEVNNTAYSLEEFIEGKGDSKFQKEMAPFQEIVGNYTGSKENLSEIKNQINKHIGNIAALKNTKNNQILADFREYFENTSNPTDKTVELGKKLAKATESKYIKDLITKKVNALEQHLKDSKANKAVEQKGGIEAIQEKKAEQKKKDSVMDNFSGPGPLDQYLQEEGNTTTDKNGITYHEAPAPESYESLDPESLAEIAMHDPSGQNINDEAFEKLDQVVGEGIISQEQADVIKENLEVTADKVIADNQADNTKSLPEVATNSTPVSGNDTLQDTVLSKGNKAVKDLGIKVLNKITEPFKRFLNRNDNKVDKPVTFRLSTANKMAPQKKAILDKFLAGKELSDKEIGQIPIQVVIDGEKENVFTALYDVTNDGNASAAEIAFRKNILASLRQGIVPKGEIEYQYSGAILQEDNIKSVKLIDELKDNVPLMFTNSKGKLLNADKDKSINREHGKTILTDGNIWAGIFFTEVTDSNGKKFPLKLNVKRLDENETELILKIFRLALKNDNINHTKEPISEHPDLLKLLSKADLNYLGADANLNKVLSHLVFENKTNAITKIDMNLKEGILELGKYKFTYRDLHDAHKVSQVKKFLLTYKPRNVSVNKIINEPAYKDFILDNAILGTDAVINNGEVFQIDEEADTSQEVNRYRTKAIYVKNTLTQGVNSNVPAAVKANTQPQAAKTQPSNTITYTPKGKDTQTYTIEGSKILNNKREEVFAKESTDRRKIFANLAIKEGRANVVEHKGKKYVVNNKQQIMSVATGNIMKWADNNGDRKAVLKLAQTKTQPSKPANFNTEKSFSDTLEQQRSQEKANVITYKKVGLNQGTIVIDSLDGGDIADFTSKKEGDQLLAGYRKLTIDKLKEIDARYDKAQKALKNMTASSQTNKIIPSDLTTLTNFEGTIVDYVEHIGFKEDGREIGANNLGKGTKIQVVIDTMKEKFKNKAWTQPTNSEPIATDAFATFEEFMLFMYLHEKAHEYIFRDQGESLISYETRINNEALRRLAKEYNTSSQPISTSNPKEAVAEMKRQSDELVLSDDNSVYTDAEGNEYKRVTSFIDPENTITDMITDSETMEQYEERLVALGYTGKTLENQLNLSTSTRIGTAIDNMVRDYFSDNFTGIGKYTNIAPKPLLVKFEKELAKLKTQFEANGETVVSEEITLFNKEIGVAGTVDIMTYDKNGKFRIYDLKTKKRGLSYIHKSFEGKMTDMEKWSKQLSMYRILMNNTYGIKAVDLGIIPIKVWYSPRDTSTSELKLLKQVKIKPLEQVESAKLDASQPIPPSQPAQRSNAETKSIIDNALNKKPTQKVIDDALNKDKTKEGVIVSAEFTQQGTKLEFEIIGDTGKEFLISLDRNGSINLWSEKQTNGSYFQGDIFPTQEAVNKLYNKYIPSDVRKAITNWLNSFEDSWAAPETAAGKKYNKVEKIMTDKLKSLNKNIKESTKPLESTKVFDNITEKASNKMKQVNHIKEEVKTKSSKAAMFTSQVKAKQAQVNKVNNKDPKKGPCN